LDISDYVSFTLFVTGGSLPVARQWQAHAEQTANGIKVIAAVAGATETPRDHPDPRGDKPGQNGCRTRVRRPFSGPVVPVDASCAATATAVGAGFAGLSVASNLWVPVSGTHKP
jgi:hypothetical protein